MSWSVVASLALFGAGCWLWPRRWHWLTAGVVVWGLLLALLTSIHLVADWFTGQGIDESVLYHLIIGLEGAGFAEYLGVIGASVGLLLVSVLFGMAYLHLVRLGSGLSPWWGLVAMPLWLGGWMIHPGSQALVQVGVQYALAAPSAHLPEGFVQPTAPRLDDGEQRPRNLVLIYAESLERTYFDEDVFPGLLPRLGERQAQGLNFTGIDQLPGMGWTVAGMVGSQCGTPLGRSPGWSSQGGENNFLPLATCLGDVLEEAGYSLHYMGGSKSEFAGKGSFYRSHGYHKVEGVEELSVQLDAPDYRNAWGLYDDSLLPMVAERFDELASQDRPFVLTTLTLDTHHPDGHVSASCRDQPYAEGDNPILQAVHCSDRLLDSLIEHILASPHAEDTLVVLVSDHMAMRNSASEVLEQHPRRNLFMVLGDGVEAQEVARDGSQLDMAPTLLPLLGFDIEALGLGRNLLGETPTFHEAHDGDHDAVRALYPRLGGLWAFPDLARGLHVDTTREQLIIGKRRIDYPALLQVAEDGEQVVGILQDDDYLAALETLPVGTGFIWVDRCQRNALMDDPASSHCLVASPAGDARAYQWALDEKTRRFDTAELWHSDEREPLPPREILISRLRLGGWTEEWPDQDSDVKWAIANPGMTFVGWHGVEGAARYLTPWWPETPQAPEPEAEFDLDIAADTPDAEFRSAWVGVARAGDGVIDEHLSPGDASVSIARATRWQPGVGGIDLRAFGGFKVDRPEAFVRHDGETLLSVERGIGLVVLSPEGDVVQAATYDTHASSRESEALADALKRVSRGQYVLLASADEFTDAATPSLQVALQSLGFSLRLTR